MKQTISLFALIVAFPAFAEDTRALDSHEHGVGALNIAIDGATVVMAFEAPGADIVGFEYAAESDADLVAIDEAIATLSAPFDLFVLPDAAGCSLVDAHASLEGDDGHDDHGQDDEDHDAHDDNSHDDEDHDEHEEEAGHTEFHAEYMLTCDNPDALTDINFTYFEAFPNAQEVEVQRVSASGALAFEVTRDAPVLDLGR